jgi:hypothetical protein
VFSIVDSGNSMIVGEQLGSWETGSVSGYERQDLEHDHHGFQGGEEEVGSRIAVYLEFNVMIPKIYQCSVAGNV